MSLATNALTDIVTCEAELSLTAAAQDALLTRYINTASQAIENYLGRPIVYGAALVQKVPGSLDSWLYVDRRIVVITSIVDPGGDTVTASDYSIWDADAGAIYNSSGWVRTNISTTQKDRYVVTYEGGWITPAQVGTRTLPYDIETACVEMVTNMWRQQGADSNIASESILGTSVSYRATPTAAMPTGVMAILDSYKRIDNLWMVP